MTNTHRTAFGALVLLLATVVPAAAQIQNAVEFTTSFPFYAQNTKLPAGSYKLVRTDIDNTLLLESANGTFSAFLEFTPTRSAQPHQQTDVTFHKYGNVDYLKRVWVAGDEFGMRFESTKSEKKAAAATRPTEHSISGKKS